MKRLQFFLTFVAVGLLSSSSAFAAKYNQPSKGRDLISLSLEESGLEFQKLRKTKGHFSGGKWSDSVDKWMGRKHQVMLHLQQKLTSKRADKHTIISIMGNPDIMLNYNDPQAPEFYLNTLSREVKQAGDEILIYKWRGSHDFLYFVIRKKKQLKSDWWMALE